MRLITKNKRIWFLNLYVNVSIRIYDVSIDVSAYIVYDVSVITAKNMERNLGKRINVNAASVNN